MPAWRAPGCTNHTSTFRRFHRKAVKAPTPTPSLQDGLWSSPARTRIQPTPRRPNYCSYPTSNPTAGIARDASKCSPIQPHSHNTLLTSTIVAWLPSPARPPANSHQAPANHLTLIIVAIRQQFPRLFEKTASKAPIGAELRGVVAARNPPPGRIRPRFQRRRTSDFVL